MTYERHVTVGRLNGRHTVVMMLGGAVHRVFDDFALFGDARRAALDLASRLSLPFKEPEDGATTL